jgi:hypothetical protein
VAGRASNYLFRLCVDDAWRGRHRARFRESQGLPSSPIRWYLGFAALIVFRPAPKTAE